MFIGLSPGFPPWGREPLLKVVDSVNGFRSGEVITLATAKAHSIELPQEEKVALERALMDWHEAAPCDDNLLLLR
jgi:hypothetical protein